MNKKLLDKLDGFNLSMQQKTQLIELIKEVGNNNNSNANTSNIVPFELIFNGDVGKIKCRDFELDFGTDNIYQDNDVYQISVNSTAFADYLLSIAIDNNNAIMIKISTGDPYGQTVKAIATVSVGQISAYNWGVILDFDFKEFIGSFNIGRILIVWE